MERDMSLAPYRQVVADAIADGTINPEHEHMVFMGINRMVNMTGTRASDAARSEVAAYKRLGADAYVAAWQAERSAPAVAPRTAYDGQS